MVDALDQVFSLMVPRSKVKANGIVAPSSRASELDVAVVEQTRRKRLVLKHPEPEFVEGEFKALGRVAEEPQWLNFECGKDVAIHKASKRWWELGRKSRLKICDPMGTVRPNGPLPIVRVPVARFGDARSNRVLEENFPMARVDLLHKGIDQFVGVEWTCLSHAGV